MTITIPSGLLLLIPMTAQLVMSDILWTVGDFVAAGIMLFGADLTFVLIARMGDNMTYRLATDVAVGLVVSEDNPVNLVFGAVLAVAIIGATAARFQARGMSSAMFAASLTYVVVTLIALFIWPPSPATAEPQVGIVNALGANEAFAAMWAFRVGCFPAPAPPVRISTDSWRNGLEALSCTQP